MTALVGEASLFNLTNGRQEKHPDADKEYKLCSFSSLTPICAPEARGID